MSGPNRPPPARGDYLNNTTPQREGSVSGPSGTRLPTATEEGRARADAADANRRAAMAAAQGNAARATAPGRIPTVRVPLNNSWGLADPTYRMGYNPDAFERFPEGSRAVPVSRAVDAWLNLSPGYRAWIDGLATHPNIGTSRSSGRMLWERAASLAGEEGGTSPQQVLLRLAQSVAVDYGTPLDWVSRGGSGSYGRGGGGGGSSTQMTIDITTPTGARALLTQAMQGILGRDPNDDEISKFTTALNESQKANPQVVSAMGDTVTRTGGFEADVFAQDFVQNQEEFQEVRGTQFYRGLIDALRGGGI